MDRKYTLKQVISAAVGVPAATVAVLGANGEELWLSCLCMSAVLGILIWNYGAEALEAERHE